MHVDQATDTGRRERRPKERRGAPRKKKERKKKEQDGQKYAEESRED